MAQPLNLTLGVFLEGSKSKNLLLQIKLFIAPTVSKLSLNNSKGNSLIRKAVFTMLLSKLFSVLGYKVCWISHSK